MFELDLPPSPELWIAGPLAGLALLSLNAWLSSRKVLRASPAHHAEGIGVALQRIAVMSGDVHTGRAGAALDLGREMFDYPRYQGPFQVLTMAQFKQLSPQERAAYLRPAVEHLRLPPGQRFKPA